jgi:hypothetical protein
MRGVSERSSLLSIICRRSGLERLDLLVQVALLGLVGAYNTAGSSQLEM